MKQEAIDLVFLIDQSGSMAGLEDDTIGGFNTLLKQQQAIAGEAYVTTVLFDDRYERIHDHTEIRLVPPLTSQDYTPCGSTALLDAIGRTIRHIEMEQRKRGRNQREKVLFFIITDGQENASRHYTFPMIRSQIERQSTGGNSCSSAPIWTPLPRRRSLESTRIGRRITEEILSVHPQCIAPYPPCQLVFAQGRGSLAWRCTKANRLKPRRKQRQNWGKP